MNGSGPMTTQNKYQITTTNYPNGSITKKPLLNTNSPNLNRLESSKKVDSVVSLARFQLNSEVNKKKNMEQIADQFMKNNGLSPKASSKCNRSKKEEKDERVIKMLPMRSSEHSK